MRPILHKTILLSLMTVFAIGTVVAQPPSSNPVEPGTKGNLPAVQDIPAATEDILPILHLEMVTGHYVSNAYTQELSLRFPDASTFGGQYYILQYKSGGSWVDYVSYDGVVHFEGDNAGPTHIANEYRLKLVGGNKGGWVSNVITVPYVNTLKCFLTWLDYNESLFTGSGILLRNCLPYVQKTNDDGENEEFNEKSPYFVYKWYRRNPNTYEMTLIEGATDFEYTPTMEDVGYEIVKVVMGDNDNVAFYGAHTDGIVKMPIEASVEYLDRNGFVLNTSYVLPDGGKGLCLSAEPGDPYCESVPLPEGSVKELKPGQYAVSINVEQYEGREVRYADDRYRVAFLYEFPDWGGDGQMKTTYREAQLMPERYMRPLQIKPLLNGESVATTIDILGKGLDGKFKVIESLTPDKAENGIFNAEVFQGKYYVKARQTDGTLETYYPNALVWSDAKFIEPEAESWDEDWQPTCATINMVEAPAPLTGSSVIEGTIMVVNKARTRGEDATTYTVYLKNKATGKVIAQTQTNASGNYRFENVPIGEYIVVPNVDGYKAETTTPAMVAVTQEKQTVSNVDCTVTEATIAEIFKEEPEMKGDADGNGTVDTKDVIQMVNYIINPATSINKANADYNGDGVVNVTDIILLINDIVN
jgi:hypothetical protein